jgi:hypothetical protein
MWPWSRPVQVRKNFFNWPQLLAGSGICDRIIAKEEAG